MSPVIVPMRSLLLFFERIYLFSMLKGMSLNCCFYSRATTKGRSKHVPWTLKWDRVSDTPWGGPRGPGRQWRKWGSHSILKGLAERWPSRAKPAGQGGPLPVTVCAHSRLKDGVQREGKDGQEQDLPQKTKCMWEGAEEEGDRNGKETLMWQETGEVVYKLFLVSRLEFLHYLFSILFMGSLVLIMCPTH